MASTIIKFGLIAFALLALFQLSKYTLFFPNLSIEIWIAVFAILFVALGYILSRSIVPPKPRQENSSSFDPAGYRRVGLSDREYEVLLEIARGHSNREIAEKLFVSESTIKTHVSNILTKLNAKRRTHAVTIAKQLHLIE